MDAPSTPQNRVTKLCSSPGQNVSVQELVLTEEHATVSKAGNDLTDSDVANPNATMNFSSENLRVKNLNATQLGLSLEDEVEKTNAEEITALAENGINNSCPENAVKRSRGRPRRSNVSTGENLGKNEKKKMNNVVVNEFSKTMTHLRYLLHRMAYEQNLLDVYFGEGWKGQSAEKLRPEKELKRAKSEIFRCKLKVRALFQHIDLSISKGRLPESLFDSEGQIDSEDIFCAKCGLKDVTLENDIILCDGACKRALHQFCVQPPLLKEDIPPDDEGWLCPGCDCKDNCIALLNESQGTNLSILDSWEKVYPEAVAAAAAEKTPDNNLELPSDDSEDNDYKPDETEEEENVGGDESSSDESGTYSASEDSEVAPATEQNLQLLPSDDSEDDEFDPDAADVDEDVKQQSSSSNFTSYYEDLNVVIDTNGSSHENSNVHNVLMSDASKVGRGKRPLVNDELSSLLKTTTSQGDSALISGRREVERLDYKKLYDEQYGDVSTDSSDEEYFNAVDAPKRRKINGNNGGKTSKSRARKKLYTEGTNDSPVKSSKVPSKPDSSCSGAKTSAARRLGETATQGLLISFKENQYPELATKEKLAAELGITVHQVSKWFENARWSFRHSPHLESKLAEIPSEGVHTQLNQSERRPNISANVVKSGVQSGGQSLV